MGAGTYVLVKTISWVRGVVKEEFLNRMSCVARLQRAARPHHATQDEDGERVVGIESLRRCPSTLRQDHRRGCSGTDAEGAEDAEKAEALGAGRTGCRGRSRRLKSRLGGLRPSVHLRGRGLWVKAHVRDRLCGKGGLVKGVWM